MVERLTGSMELLRCWGKEDNRVSILGAAVIISMVGGVVHGWYGERVLVDGLGCKYLVIDD